MDDLNITCITRRNTRRSSGCLALCLPVAMLLLGPLGGCEDTSGPLPAKNLKPPPDPNLGFIAFVGAGRNHPLWPILKTGAEQYAHDTAKLEIRFLSPGGNSAQDQINLLQTLNEPAMRGLCVQIIDADAIQPVLNHLYNRGILIVSMINPAPERIRVAHVGFEDEAIGRELARATARALGDNGSIMLLHAGIADPIFAPRLRGFGQEMAYHLGIHVLAKLDCQKDPRQARDLIRDRSSRYPRLSAWVALDDWPIRDIGDIPSIIPPGCRFITFGGTPDQWPLIRKGISPAIVAANYREIGLKAAQFCESAILQPSRFKNHYIAPLRTIGAANLDQYIRDWTFWSTGQYKQDNLPIDDFTNRGTPGNPR